MATKEQIARYGTTLGILDALPISVRRKRNEEGLSLRAAAEQIGISWTTLRSVEESLHHTRVDVIRAVLEWLGE
jgi:predicted transcriptional regulator